MTAQTFLPIEARPAPNKSEGPLAWIRINLFSDVFTSLLTLIVGGALLYVIPQLLSWAIFRAACRSPLGASHGLRVTFSAMCKIELPPSLQGRPNAT